MGCTRTGRDSDNAAECRPVVRNGIDRSAGDPQGSAAQRPRRKHGEGYHVLPDINGILGDIDDE